MTDVRETPVPTYTRAQIGQLTEVLEKLSFVWYVWINTSTRSRNELVDNYEKLVIMVRKFQ